MNWGNSEDKTTTLCAPGIVADIVANVPQRSERWFIRKPSSVLTRLNALSELKRAQANLK